MALRRGVLSLLAGLPREMMSLEWHIAAVLWDRLFPTQPPSDPRVPGCLRAPCLLACTGTSFLPLSTSHATGSLKLCGF